MILWMLKNNGNNKDIRIRWKTLPKTTLLRKYNNVAMYKKKWNVKGNPLIEMSNNLLQNELLPICDDTWETTLSFDDKLF